MSRTWEPRVPVNLSCYATAGLQIQKMLDLLSSHSGACFNIGERGGSKG